MPASHTLATLRPATSVDVERVFSRGHLLLSHVRNRLSAQTTRALLCLGQWSSLDLVKREDLEATAKIPEVEEGGDDYEMDEGFESLYRKLVDAD